MTRALRFGRTLASSQTPHEREATHPERPAETCRQAGDTVPPLATHYRRTGDLENRAKVNISKGAIQKLRGQVLVTRVTEVRDLAQGAVTHADAARRGITAARITALTAALAAFAPDVNAARGQIVNRSALLRELETDVAALMDLIEELDDLVLQFDSEAGQNFQAAWTGARKIVDGGHGPGEEEDPESGNPTPTP